MRKQVWVRAAAGLAGGRAGLLRHRPELQDVDDEQVAGADGGRLLLERLGEDSRYRRFLSPSPELSDSERREAIERRADLLLEFGAMVRRRLRGMRSSTTSGRASTSTVRTSA